MLNKVLLVALIVFVDAKLTIYLTDTPIQRIGTRIYRKELLTNAFQSPKELAYDSSSRNLFFMYMDDLTQNSRRAFINVVTKQAMKIEGIERNKATAVDPDTSDVYFGSDDGLYKYDPISNTATNIGLYNMNVFKIVIRNNAMYLIDANDHRIYKIFNEGKTAVRIGNMKTVMEFEVDNQNNVHLVTMCGVFCAYNSQEIVKNTDLRVVYHFFVEEDNTFGLTDDGIYQIDCFNGTARKVANIDFYPSSLIFGDYGDIFYSIENDIYRLRPINSYQILNIRKHNH
ncbi:ommochrome-binding protein-like [Trichoplusia ni]|uniref:Ommochrome-binding protein-like n=1 Tax=Trichoplusia ni TaxID=7111 RepID=A0A7E5WUN7_TRINI|nr:ommochrome-binding protein-like [Trichoplusia ni]